MFAGLIVANVYDPAARWMGPDVQFPQIVYLFMEGLAFVIALGIGVLAVYPRQLPPIGAGRPFVDIVKRLAPEGITERFPRVGPSYAELVIRMRQLGEDR